MGEEQDVDGRGDDGSGADAGEVVAVGCGLGVLVALAATWFSLSPLGGNWAECDAEPGAGFGLLLVLPVVFFVHYCAFALAYGLLRRSAGWVGALTGAGFVVLVLVLVVGQVLLLQLAVPADLCDPTTRSPGRFPAGG